MDFLIVLAIGMDANRNEGHYVKPNNSAIDDYLGKRDWRQKWENVKKAGTSFPIFLAEEYSIQMKNLGYLETPISKMRVIRSDEKNLPLYHLAFFSRNNLGMKFWYEALRYSDRQLKIPGTDLI